MPLSGPKLENPFPLTALLQAGLDRDPSGPAILTLDETASWAELDAQSRHLARNYLAMGLCPGERVATLMPNRTALIAHHLACLWAGLVSTPLNYRYTAPEIDHALDVSGAALLVHHAERDADIAASRRTATLPRGRLRYGAGGDAQANDPGTVRYEDLLQASPADQDLPEIRPGAPLFIFFTSGSTGPAKGVTHTVDSIGWMIANFRTGLGIGARDVLLTTTSHSYLGGLSFALIAFSAGIPLAMARTFDSDEVFALIRRTRPTVTWMLPSTLYELVNGGQCCRDDFASFRYVATAGDKAPTVLEQRFEEVAGYGMREIYGMTEAIEIGITPPEGLNKQGSVGRPGPGVMASLRNEHGAEVPVGAVGRLWIRYPGLMSGYWNRPEATAEVFRDGWFDTGDLMRADADGYLWFAGRRKQIIVHDGSNIAPQEVEAALLEHEAVHRAGVVGVHDVKHGETVWGYVELRPGATRPSPQDLILFARARVGYKAPEVVVILDQLPVNAVGKTDRMALKRMAAEAHGAENADELPPPRAP